MNTQEITIDGKRYILTPIKDSNTKSINRKAEARKYLEKFIKEPRDKWQVRLIPNGQIWSVDGQWVFELDFKNKTCWCHFHTVWKVFYNKYHLKYEEVQELMKEVVLKALNCERFTPKFLVGYSLSMLKALNR